MTDPIAAPERIPPNTWAVVLFHGNRAHLFRPVSDDVVERVGAPRTDDRGEVHWYASLCGAVYGAVTLKAPWFNPGDFPRCKNCQRKATDIAADGAAGGRG